MGVDFCARRSRPHHSLLKITRDVWIKKINKKEYFSPSIYSIVNTEPELCHDEPAAETSRAGFFCFFFFLENLNTGHFWFLVQYVKGAWKSLLLSSPEEKSWQTENQQLFFDPQGKHLLPKL